MSIWSRKWKSELKSWISKSLSGKFRSHKSLKNLLDVFLKNSSVFSLNLTHRHWATEISDRAGYPKKLDHPKSPTMWSKWLLAIFFEPLELLKILFEFPLNSSDYAYHDIPIVWVTMHITESINRIQGECLLRTRRFQ